MERELPKKPTEPTLRLRTPCNSGNMLTCAPRLLDLFERFQQCFLKVTIIIDENIYIYSCTVQQGMYSFA
jgi:hypothetical protein